MIHLTQRHHLAGFLFFAALMGSCCTQRSLSVGDVSAADGQVATLYIALADEMGALGGEQGRAVELTVIDAIFSMYQPERKAEIEDLVNELLVMAPSDDILVYLGSTSYARLVYPSDALRERLEAFWRNISEQRR